MTNQQVAPRNASARADEVVDRPAHRLQPSISSTFLVAVAALLVLPLVSTVYSPLRRIVAAIDEHRAPAEFPSPLLLLDTSGRFAASLNKWFDDRIGLRELLIPTKNQIDYSLFHTSQKVYVGSNGMLFEHGTTDVRLTIERLDADRFRALEDAFLTLAQRLREKGIHLIVVGYPDKSMLYPERLPAQAPTIARGGSYDRLRQFLAEQSALTFIDAEDILNREKSQTDEPLFYTTDIHVGLVGQIPVVKAIVDTIAHIEGRTDIEWHEQLDLKHVDWGTGSEGRFLSLLSPVHEQITYAAAGYAVGQDEPDGQWNVPDPRAIDAVGDGNGLPFDFEFHSAPQLCDKRLPGTVLFGNSFSDLYWTLGLHRYYCFIRRSRTPIGRLPALVGTIPPGTKYFIFQYLAAYLPGEGPWLK